MTLEIRWYDEAKTIIYHRYVGDWTLEETYHIIDATYDMMMSVSHTVNVITDMREAGKAPNILSTSRYANQRIAPNSGIAYLIQPGNFMITIVHIARRLIPQYAAHLDTADDIEDALEKIKAR
ncbi:MAG: hypothetical protein ACOYL5_14085 [Phototrophicaceae bacterium]|jgi:hypothetical protein